MSTTESALSYLHPSEIKEAEENPRSISPDRFKALCYALEQDPSMLEARPVIVDLSRRDVVCGNMRLRAAKHLGWDRIPVYLKKFDSDAQRREWMLRDNQEYGEWVPDELSALVAQHEVEGSDLRLLGFSEQELTDLRKLGEPDLPDQGDAGIDDMTEVWGIVIDCSDEGQQADLLEEFADRGLKCRALMVWPILSGLPGGPPYEGRTVNIPYVPRLSEVIREQERLWNGYIGHLGSEEAE